MSMSVCGGVWSVYARMHRCVCVCACVRACMRACVRARVSASQSRLGLTFDVHCTPRAGAKVSGLLGF